MYTISISIFYTERVLGRGGVVIPYEMDCILVIEKSVGVGIFCIISL